MIRINFGDYKSRISKTTTVEELRSVMYEIIDNMQKQFDGILGGMVKREDLTDVAGTFTTADTPPKTVTVSNGIITQMK
jgi:hypothetical protein